MSNNLLKCFFYSDWNYLKDKYFQGLIVLSLVAVSSVSCMTSKYAPITETHVPQPYSYQYGVKDEYSNANFAKTESQDAQV